MNADVTLLVRDGSGVMTRWTAEQCDLTGMALDDPGHLVMSVPLAEWRRVRLVDPLGGDGE